MFNGLHDHLYYNEEYLHFDYGSEKSHKIYVFNNKNNSIHKACCWLMIAFFSIL